MSLAIVVFLFEVLTNADIVKLVKAGLSPQTIEAKIANSETKFDTSTEALVALADADVPDSVIRMMIEQSAQAVPAVPAVPVRPAVAPVPPLPPAPVSRRYEVSVHRSRYAKCDGGELRVDGRGVRTSRCKGIDFDLAWDDVTSICYDYGFRGTIVFEAGDKEHRISTTTPAEAKKILGTIRGIRPDLAAAECR